jgi:HlyD family secretion protein
MRVGNGPAFKGALRQDIFVLKDGKAYRRTVDIGSSNFDFVQIKNHVTPGETVIISDMSEYKHLQEVDISRN